MTIRSVFPVFGALLLAATAPLAAEALDLRRELGPDTYEAAGLDKLTPEERAVLADWLAGRLGREREETTERYVARGVEGFGLEGVPERTRVPVETPDLIESTIPGVFRGWSGRTRFVLANGQEWEQIEAGSFSIRREDPVVRIRRGTFGTYFLQVDGYGSRVKVRRVR